MLSKKGASFYLLTLFFILFVFFLYGPILTIILLSFQGPQGGLTFPLNGFSFHWFHKLWEGGGYVDIGAAFRRSIILGIVVMILTVVFSVSAVVTVPRAYMTGVVTVVVNPLSSRGSVFVEPIT